MNSGQDARFQTAIAHFQAGRLAEAKSDCEKILNDQPNNIMALHLYGILYCQQGDPAKGSELIAEAVRLAPENPAAQHDLGKALHAHGKLEDAAQAFQRAVDLKPDFADAHNNLGNVLKDLGRLEDAVAAYERAQEADPSMPQPHNNQGNALNILGRLEDARACYERALALYPDYAEAHYNLGNLLHNQGALEEAAASYERTLALRPDFEIALNNMGSAFQGLGRYTEARETFDRLLRLKYGGDLWNAPVFDDAHQGPIHEPLAVSNFKLGDAIDQIEYLIERGRIDKSFARLAERYRAVLMELRDSVDQNLTADQAAQIGAYCDRVIHFDSAPRMAGPAINPALDFQGMEDEYLSSAVAVIKFDDFLTPEAWSALRDFCLESTIFFEHTGDRFVSSRSNMGFNCDLLYQMAEELQASMPRVLGDHGLNNMWIYRHNNRSEGVAAHTDDGSVTFNFWITPNDANQSPGEGGLVVYAKEQPLDWDWTRYNKYKYGTAMKAEIDAFLSDAKTVTIPYGGNRAVLFHSNLFHKSDRVNFKDGFVNRRMNITMLFGRRGS